MPSNVPFLCLANRGSITRDSNKENILLRECLLKGSRISCTPFSSSELVHFFVESVFGRSHFPRFSSLKGLGIFDGFRSSAVSDGWGVRSEVASRLRCFSGDASSSSMALFGALVQGGGVVAVQFHSFPPSAALLQCVAAGFCTGLAFEIQSSQFSEGGCAVWDFQGGVAVYMRR
jgi:hypothetical protein